jgi:membrane-associated phospholipid phosphatase
MNLKSVLLLDARASDRMRVAEKPGLLRNFSIFFAHSGDSWFWGLGLILLWLLGGSFWKRWSIIVLIGISVLAVLVLSLKFIIRRRRPEGEWGGIYRNTDPHSFPSGHAARAFMIAMVATGLGPPWFAMVLWVWAPLVALARVAMGVHYLSDIVAGLGLGVLMGLLVLALYPPLLMWIANLLKFPFF